MNEIRSDYYDKLREQNLIRRVGRISKPRLPTERELQAQNKPVKIIVYPNLETLPKRIKYLQGQETVVDFCRRAEIGMKVYYRIVNGTCEGNLLDDRFFNRLAQNLHCPVDWLQNGKNIDNGKLETKKANITAEESVMLGESPALDCAMEQIQTGGIVLNMCGLYTAKQLSMILTGLGEHTFDVQLNLKEKVHNCECSEVDSL